MHGHIEPTSHNTDKRAYRSLSELCELSKLKSALHSNNFL